MKALTSCHDMAWPAPLVRELACGGEMGALRLFMRLGLAWAAGRGLAGKATFAAAVG